jgi:hypothetical protein
MATLGATPSAAPSATPSATLGAAPSATLDTGWIEYFCPLRNVHVADIVMDSNYRISYTTPKLTLSTLNILSGACIVESWDHDSGDLCVRLCVEEANVLQSLEWRIQSLAVTQLVSFDGIYIPLSGNGCVRFSVKNQPWVWRDGAWSRECRFEKGQTIRWAVRFEGVHLDYSLTLDHQVVAIICMNA